MILSLKVITSDDMDVIILVLMILNDIIMLMTLSLTGRVYNVADLQSVGENYRMKVKWSFGGFGLKYDFDLSCWSWFNFQGQHVISNLTPFLYLANVGDDDDVDERER